MKQNLLLSLFISLCLSLPEVSAQTRLRVETILRDTNFSSIAVADNGEVFAGTPSAGMVRYDKATGGWKTWNGLLNSLVRPNLRQLITTGDSVWIATSGYPVVLGQSAGTNRNVSGGVHVMTNKNKYKKEYYRGASVAGIGTKNGPPTRNVMGVCFDQNGTPWVAADYHDSSTYVGVNARYFFSPGGVAKFDWDANDFLPLENDGMPNPTGILIGSPNLNKENNYSFGKRKGSLSIASVKGEIWAGCNGYEESAGNIVTAGITRYNTNGEFIGKLDENNTGIPFGLLNTSTGPWAIHQDAKGRVWIALSQTRGLAVLDVNNQWIHIGLPTVLNGEQIRANAIAGDRNDRVFFGSNAGLLVYNGEGDLTSPSSYELWTTANGLSSNYIAGVAVGKDNTIWLATSAGINKIIQADLTVYNLFNDIYTNSRLQGDLFRRQVAFYDSNGEQSAIDQDTLFIAADGTRATVFKWVGSDLEHIRFRIKDGAINTTDEEIYGRFEYNYFNNEKTDSVLVQYYHPTYIESMYTVSNTYNGKPVRIQIVDVSSSPENVLLDIPVKYVLPPLLMVHGLWSEGETWEEMETYFLTNGLYKYKPYEVMAPSYPNARHFKDNRVYISKFLDDLLRECSQNRISAGAADIVAHSMGGILSRLYLQEGVGSVAYSKNIHKLITINTPHAGSPLANLVESKNDIFKWVVKKGAGDPTKGALGDLSLGKAPIDSLLNGPDLNKNVVPSHAIYSSSEVGQKIERAWASIRFRSLGSFISFGLTYYASSVFGCTFTESINSCLERLFKGQSDLIVSEESQIGGLPPRAITYFSDYTHVEVYKDGPVIRRVQDLLRAKSTSRQFTTDGFHPAKLKWDLKSGTQYARRMAETLEIESPGYGASFNRGDSVHVQINAGSSIARMMFMIGYGDQLGIAVAEAPRQVFSFKIPDDVLDRMNYQVFGFTASGDVFTDSSYIMVNPDPSIVLEGIRIKTNQHTDMKITIGDSLPISIIGSYSDGLERELTYQPGISFSTLMSGVSLDDEGFIKGLILGYDELKVGYNGFFDSLDVEVIPPIEYDTVKADPLPVTFGELKARYNGNRIEVEWNTSSEQSNHYFVVEHSTNGQTFRPVGRINASNLPNGSHYTFHHKEYASGNNYYRIKQVDLDGNSSYSITVVAMVNVQKKIVIYPNPVDDVLQIDLRNSDAMPSDLMTMRLSNSFGQVVMTKNITGKSSKVTVSLSGLPAGIYILTIIDKTNQNLITEKIIKNK